MLGFLLKILIVAAVVGGIGYVVFVKSGALTNPSAFKASLENTFSHLDGKQLAANLSSSLDSLVSHPESDSPLVLGAKISNESISKLVDTLQSLPPEQVNQVKAVLCAPLLTPTPASPSGQPL